MFVLHCTRFTFVSSHVQYLYSNATLNTAEGKGSKVLWAVLFLAATCANIVFFRIRHFHTGKACDFDEPKVVWDDGTTILYGSYLKFLKLSVYLRIKQISAGDSHQLTEEFVKLEFRQHLP